MRSAPAVSFHGGKVGLTVVTQVLAVDVAGTRLVSLAADVAGGELERLVERLEPAWGLAGKMREEAEEAQ